MKEGNVELQKYPAFRAYLNSPQTIVDDAAAAVIQMGNESFDTDGCYDTGTYRFTPTRAGYYLIYFKLMYVPTAALGAVCEFHAHIHKNGTLIALDVQNVENISGSNNNNTLQVSTIDEANGTTDYYDFRAFHNNTNNVNINTSSGSNYVYAHAHWVHD